MFSGLWISKKNIYRDIFRIPSDICDGSLAVNYLHKKSCTVDVWQGPKCVSDSYGAKYSRMDQVKVF